MAKEKDKAFEVTKEIMYSYIKKAGRNLNTLLLKSEYELGSRYNQGNPFELMKRNFGNPDLTPEKFLEEYELIKKKASKQSSNVRYAIEAIVNEAIRLLTIDYHKKSQETSKKPAEKAPEKDKKPRVKKVSKKVDGSKTRKTESKVSR